MYNLTALGTVSNPIGILTIINANVDYLLAGGLVIIIFIGMLFYLSEYDFTSRLMSASLVTTMLSFFLAQIGWVSSKFIIGPAILLAVSMVLKWMDSRGYF
jgi:hypothetical protein